MQERRNKFGKKLWKLLLSAYEYTEGFLLAALVLMLVADVLLGILARYIQFEVVFATELGKYIFIWLCAIGISAAAKDNQHVRLSFFVEKLPVDRKVTWVFSQVIFLIFTLFFFYWGAKLTLMHIALDKSAMGFHFPMFVFTAALPIGFALTSLRLVLDIISSIRGSYETPPWDNQKSTGLGGITNEE